MFETTVTDQNNKLGLGFEREIEIEVSYKESKGKGPTWGPRGGSPAEPPAIEILHVRVLNAPQSLEGDIIDVFGDVIEEQIKTFLDARDEAAEDYYFEDR